uniref:CSON015331 protein n=1 Tax=Culicoides sonorensis TaxID=179676 RepID=A0A336LNG7_CULSO
MALLPPDPVFTLNHRKMGSINSLCFHQNERLFVATKKGQIYLYDLQTNRSTFNMNIGENPLISIHHTEDSLISMEKGGTLKSFSLTNNGYKMANEIQLNHSGFCRLDYDSQSNILIAPKNENTVSVLAVDTFEESQSLSLNSESRTGVISSVKYLNIQGQPYVLAGYESGILNLWDLRMSNVLASEQFDQFLTSIDYDLVTNRGIITSISDKISLFSINMKSSVITKKADLPIKNPGVHCVKIRKDLKVFVTAGFDGRLRVFSWKSLRPLAVLSDHKGDLMDIAFSNGPVSFWKSNIMAAGGSDGKITLWDIYK